MNREFLEQVVEAADTVASVLAAHSLRGAGPYPIGEILPILAEQHEALRRVIANHPGPIGLDAHGKQSSLVGEIGTLYSYLALVEVLYHGLDDIPAALRPVASRTLSGTHLTARRVRDHTTSRLP